MPPSNLLSRAHLWYAGHGPNGFATFLSYVHPDIISLNQVEDCWQLQTKTDTYYLSDQRQITRFIGMGIDMLGRVREKYTCPGFVEVGSGDIVVDVGAFIGEFSRSVAPLTDRLIAIEPDTRNYQALKRNLEHWDHTEAMQLAAWNETGTLSFNVANDPSEGSILDVDSTYTGESITVDTTRIDDLAEEIGLERIDFLKIEAEGAEPEVFEGTGSLHVEKLAIECAPERDGSSPADVILEQLESQKYETRLRGNVVFAKR